MSRIRRVLGSKIHRARVTHADLHYEGSITLPPDLMEAAQIHQYEHVHVWNVTRGTRLETYAIEGQEDSREICVNGAAAHLASPGDIVIIANFIDIPENEINTHHPRIVLVDHDNNMKAVTEDEIPGPLSPKTTANK